MRRKRNVKINVKRIIINLTILFAIFFICTKADTIMITANSVSGKGSSQSSKTNYEIIKEDINEKYLGSGQVKVSGKDRIFYNIYYYSK